MELTFVHQYSGEAPKRRRLAKACESCRARKKRCVHFAGAEAEEDSGQQNSSPDDAGEQTNGYANGGTADEAGSDGAQRTTPRTTRGHSKFISDLLPPAAFLNRPVPGKGADKLPNDDIGVWVDKREWDALVKQKNDAPNGANQTIISNYGFRHNQRPHSAVLGPLIDIYFKKIHPIVPLLDEGEFRQNHVGGIVPEPLVHAMCLVAAKDSEAEPHLRLSDSPTTVPARQFCTILHGSIVGALKVPVRFEKITLIRILALTSLHSEGADGAEEASLMISQAMHYAQTLGIHLGQQAATPAGNELVMKRLFWCLWIMDRSSAAMNGRPIIMSDIDIAIETFVDGESGYPAFEAWLKISHMLNKVIDLYRPTNDVSVTGWEDPFPPLEQIIDSVGGWNLPASLLATIHLFYLTVGILSHRTRGIKELISVQHSHVRQRLLTIEVIRLMNAPKSQTLHPLPLLPYAISVALSVSYHHLRQSQFEHQQADARNDFRTACKVLQSLRRTWSSADVMATLAKKVLDQLDRAPDLASFRIRRNRRNIPKGEVDFIPPPTVCNHGVGAVSQLVPVENGTAAEEATTTTDGAISMVDAANPTQPSQPDGQMVADGINLFDNMDDVFGTFMDPNYPMNLDEMAFMEEISPFDWSAEINTGT